MNEAATFPPSSRRATVGPRFAAEHADLEAWIDETPRHATVKDMYIDSFLMIVERCCAQRPTDKRYFSFKDYPLRDLMRMTVDSVAVIYPDISPKEGLVRIGRHAYPTLASKTIDKVSFSVAGRSWGRTLNLCQKAWEVSIRPGTVHLAELTDTSARFELRQIWNFTDTYQVGIFEGMMESFGMRGSVHAEPKGRRSDADIVLNWKA